MSRSSWSTKLELAKQNKAIQEKLDSAKLIQRIIIVLQ